MIPVRGPHQSEALGGCLVCLCLRPALRRDARTHFDDVVRRKEVPSGGLLFCAENIASAVVLNFVYKKPPLKKAIGLCL